MTKRRKVIILSLAVLLLFALSSCEPTGDDGGQGADFDETLYYTKTEVDGLIADAITQAVSDATPDQYTINVAAGDGPAKGIQNTGWDNRVGPWTVPDGANFGFFKIEIGSTTLASDTYVYIGANNTDQNEAFLLSDDGIAFDFILPTYGASELYAWTDDSAVAPTTNEYLVTSLCWIK